MSNKGLVGANLFANIGAAIANKFAPTGGLGSEEKKEPADKPGSVVGNHSSGPAVTGGLKQPTRKRRGPRHCFPIWSCSRWGLPCRRVLPPARCALTAPFHPYLRRGGIFSVALSVGSRPPGITWHPALWSPDFPPRSSQWLERSDCLADSQVYFLLPEHRFIGWISQPDCSSAAYSSRRGTPCTLAATRTAWLADKCSCRTRASSSASANPASLSGVHPATTSTNSPLR